MRRSALYSFALSTRVLWMRSFGRNLEASLTRGNTHLYVLADPQVGQLTNLHSSRLKLEKGIGVIAADFISLPGARSIPSAPLSERPSSAASL